MQHVATEPMLFAMQCNPYPSPTDETSDTNRAIQQAEVMWTQPAIPPASSETAVNPPTSNVLQYTLDQQRYFMNGWEQFFVLSRRSWRSLMGSYYLIACHAAAAWFLGVVLMNLYTSQKLDLSGTENKAGMITFLLLIVAFSSVSCLELFISEKKLFILERENGYYATIPYFATKVLFDYIPLRMVPTLLITSVIYFPMGLRTDASSYFLWFNLIVVLFSLFVTGTCFCVAMVTDSFGAAALFSSLLILWNTAYGGLMIQSHSIPPLFRVFKYMSPFYYGFEALMVNELEGLHCVFDPANSEGQSEGVSVPILCRQFLYNIGLVPDHFKADVVALGAGTIIFLWIALMLLSFFVRYRQ